MRCSLSKRISFLTENWLLPGVDQPLIMYGVRFSGVNLSADFGLLNVVGEETIFPGVPYVGFAFPF